MPSIPSSAPAQLDVGYDFSSDRHTRYINRKKKPHLVIHKKMPINDTVTPRYLFYRASYLSMLESIGGMSEFGSVISKER